MTGWLRDYIAHYAAIAKPLQERKTLMLANSPRAGNERKNFAVRAELQAPSDRELEAFDALQKALSKPTFLVHFGEKLTLYIDLDASKEFGFGAMIYHVFGTSPEGAYPQTVQDQAHNCFSVDSSKTHVSSVLKMLAQNGNEDRCLILR